MPQVQSDLAEFSGNFTEVYFIRYTTDKIGIAVISKYLAYHGSYESYLNLYMVHEDSFILVSDDLLMEERQNRGYVDYEYAFVSDWKFIHYDNSYEILRIETSGH